MTFVRTNSKNIDVPVHNKVIGYSMIKKLPDL
jgi:hypothetical protein